MIHKNEIKFSLFILEVCFKLIFNGSNVRIELFASDNEDTKKLFAIVAILANMN